MSRSHLFRSLTFFFAASVLVACSVAEERISCVNALDCPLGWACEEGWCAEFPDTAAGGDTDPYTDSYTDTYTDNYTDNYTDVTDETGDSTLPDDDLANGTDDLTDVPVGDDPPADDDDTPPVDGEADTDTDETDTTADEDVVVDALPDVDAVPSNPGTPCSDNDQCTGDAVCAKIFTNQTTSYCHLWCGAPNESICAGTAWPECRVVGSYALCFATAAITGNFTAKVDDWQLGNNISLNIKGQGTLQTDCVAFINTSNKWTLQCTKVTPSGGGHIQLDAMFFWDPAEHNTDGTVAAAEGRVLEVTYNAGGTVTDRWMRAIFLPTGGTLTLTAAGTTAGSTVSGSLNFTGNAYDAQFAP